MKSRKRRRFFIGLTIAACIGFILCIALQFDLFHGLQLTSTDFFFKASVQDQSKQTQDSIIIVTIDDKSLEQLGRFQSWPRLYHAQVLNVLKEANARVIVFDILFSETSPDDERLVMSEKAAGNVILPLTGTSVNQRRSQSDNIIDYVNIIKPLGILADGAVALGHANLIPDEDGIVRRVPVVIRSGDDYEMALSLVSAAKYCQQSQILKFNILDNVMLLNNQSIPLDDIHCMLINYLPAPDTSNPINIESISYVDVLKGKIDPSTFKDKLVVIGVTALGIGDIFWTPMGKIMSGVEIHAQTIRMVLTGNFLRQAPNSITLVTILIFSLLCGIVTLRFRVIWAVLFVILVFILYVLAAFSLFDQGIILNMIYPPVALLSTFVGMTLYRITSVQREKKEITRIFGRYVPPQVVRKIMSALDEGELKLGGEQHDTTVMFADIRGFTSMSDKIEPDELVGALNLYLSTVVGVASKYEGMINKFGGDSVMVVWNVPTICREHAFLAVRAAIDTQHAIEDLQAREPTLPKMFFGIGINTGKVIAGNIGSTDRLEYSVIGDSVNIADRITGIVPGGKVWIGADTYELIKERVIVKQLTPLIVKGKHEPVTIYEVTGFADSNCAGAIKNDS